MNGDGLIELCVGIAREQARATDALPADGAPSEDDAARLAERVDAYGEAVSDVARVLADELTSEKIDRSGSQARKQ